MVGGYMEIYGGGGGVAWIPKPPPGIGGAAADVKDLRDLPGEE